jgi:2'-5' RNA ligase
MSGRAASARLFVAVDPPEEVRRELASWAREAVRAAQPQRGPRTARAAIRLLDLDLLHVTLCFLGERPVEQIDQIGEELSACERPTVRLTVGAPLWLPPRRPRALAVELHDEQGALAQIQADLATKLEGAKRDGRGFRPHVTLARMRTGFAPRARTLPPTPALSFAPPELVLYRSCLSPQGASYEALSSSAIG